MFLTKLIIKTPHMFKRRNIMLLQKLKDLKELCKEFVMLRAPAEVYWFTALVWVSGALFGRWLL
tara:strand:- start:1004 stop:1195 length:192 start_codon:yes stop_codon:yes gene_type:complete